jgi:hypothetical protein
VTWDEYERTTAFRRPRDWQERPDGPDDIDLFVVEMMARGGSVSRREAIAAFAVPETGVSQPVELD